MYIITGTLLWTNCMQYDMLLKMMHVKKGQH